MHKLRIITLLITLFCALPYLTRADHVAGGYLKLTQVDREKGEFKVSLIVYIDVLIRTPQVDGILEDFLTGVNVYDKRNNQEIDFVIIGKSRGPWSVREVIYANKRCAELHPLKFEEYRFEGKVTFDLKRYADPMGYYLAWKNCCRNNAISNILDPGESSALITLDFPALLQNNQAIEFSSPEFEPLNGEYICANTAFDFDMSATDPNGDELRYTLVAPYLGANSLSFAPPGPYPIVRWVPGYSQQNMIPGAPPLQINSQTGRLSVRANTLGLFLMGISVEKYRNGQKIGSTRHEIQLPVIDCSLKTPPVPIIYHRGVAKSLIEVCPGDTLTLTTDDDPQWRFQWQRNGTNLPNANTARVVVNDGGVYTVTKSLGNVCSNDTTSTPFEIRLKAYEGQSKIQKGLRVFCEGDSLRLLADTTNVQTYYWEHKGQNIGQMSNLTVRQSGIYSLRTILRGATCPAQPDTLRIEVRASPVIEASTFGASICPGDTVSLRAKDLPNSSYEWFRTAQVVGQRNVLMVRDTGNYVLRLRDEWGCTANAAFKVEYKPDCLGAVLYIPDVFTPNSDGVNDEWVIQNIQQFADCEVSIYNRWGEIVFRSIGYSTPWDGTYQQQRVESGTYAYKIYLPSQAFSYQGRLVVWY